MKAFFCALAAVFLAKAPTQAVAGILLLALSLYTGYQIRSSIAGQVCPIVGAQYVSLSFGYEFGHV
ncbi:hypothetical protein AN958_00035 [Leucoagaricus sp. SymC.cos]|nr:hypothetical protein AN958_00035 [Leucoagaricus sp. SymC.cos]